MGGVEAGLIKRLVRRYGGTESEGSRRIPLVSKCAAMVAPAPGTKRRGSGPRRGFFSDRLTVASRRAAAAATSALVSGVVANPANSSVMVRESFSAAGASGGSKADADAAGCAWAESGGVVRFSASGVAARCRGTAGSCVGASSSQNEGITGSVSRGALAQRWATAGASLSVASALAGVAFVKMANNSAMVRGSLFASSSDSRSLFNSASASDSSVCREGMTDSPNSGPAANSGDTSAGDASTRCDGTTGSPISDASTRNGATTGGVSNVSSPNARGALAVTLSTASDGTSEAATIGLGISSAAWIGVFLNTARRSAAVSRSSSTIGSVASTTEASLNAASKRAAMPAVFDATVTPSSGAIQSSLVFSSA